MDTLNWVIDNKTWLFSGAGVAIIVAIVGWMLKKPSHVQQQSGGISSQNIQAGRDVNITQEGQPDFLQKAKREAAAKFRSAFAEAITQITGGSIDPHYLITHHKVQHDTAIFELRPFIDPDRLSDFDAATQKYRECRSALKPALLQFLQSENTRQPVDQSASFNLTVAINELLAFTDTRPTDDDAFVSLREASERLREEALKQLSMGYSMESILLWQDPNNELDRLGSYFAEVIDIYGKRQPFMRWEKINRDEFTTGKIKGGASVFYRSMNYYKGDPEFYSLAINKMNLDRAIKEVISSRTIYSHV